MAKLSLKEQEKQIMEMAEQSGVQSNYFFITTFRRYQVQLKMLDELEKSIEKDGVTTTKEYVKGRQNVYSSPAVKDYNTTTDSANRTVACLMKIIRNFNDEEDDNKDEDPLMKAINGSDEDGE